MRSRGLYAGKTGTDGMRRVSVGVLGLDSRNRREGALSENDACETKNLTSPPPFAVRIIIYIPTAN